jgi:polyhydroxyalkanoate synthesis regulator phasin
MRHLKRLAQIATHSRIRPFNRRTATVLAMVLVVSPVALVLAAGSGEQDDLHPKQGVEADKKSDEGTGSEAADRRLEAAGRRLKAAVANGEMTEKEAWDEWYETREQIIAEAIEAGELPEEKAAGYRKEIHKAELNERFSSAGGKLKAAVENGEMSREEAWAEWNTVRKQLVDEAVEAGEITEETAAAYLTEINRDALGARLSNAGQRIKSAAGRGELTEDQAWSEWYAVKEQLIQEAVELGEITEDDAADVHQEMRQAELKERIDSSGERIKAAVENGEMSEEEGWDAWRTAREELITAAAQAGEISADVADEFSRGYERWAVGQRLRAAVARGEMTEAEARAQWEEYNAQDDDAPSAGAAGEEKADRSQKVSTELEGRPDFEELTETLELDQAQQVKVQAFGAQHDDNDRAAVAKLRVLQAALTQARESGDEARVAVLQSQIDQVQAARVAAEEALYDRINGILRSDQATRFAEYRDNIRIARGLDGFPADLRATIRAATKVRLSRQQRTALRKIRDDARERYREARREDRKNRSRERAAEKALAAQVRAEILQMLDAEQQTKYLAELRKLSRKRDHSGRSSRIRSR